jgi:hypothetical protein
MLTVNAYSDKLSIMMIQSEFWISVSSSLMNAAIGLNALGAAHIINS